MNAGSLSDDKCAICGKDRRQHNTGSGYGVCMVYPVFCSERQMFVRLASGMEAATAGETCNRLDPKDESAGLKGIAQNEGDSTEGEV